MIPVIMQVKRNEKGEMLGNISEVSEQKLLIYFVKDEYTVNEHKNVEMRKEK